MSTNTQERTLTQIRAKLAPLIRDRKNISQKDIIFIVVKGMEFYELYLTEQSGEMKKQSLLDLVQRIVMSLDIPEQTKSELCAFIQGPELALTIDFISSASKGKLRVNKKQRRAWVRAILTNCFCRGVNAEIDALNTSVEHLVDSPASPIVPRPKRAPPVVHILDSPAAPASPMSPRSNRAPPSVSMQRTVSVKGMD